jgi:hypothetical protein
MSEKYPLWSRLKEEIFSQLIRDQWGPYVNREVLVYVVRASGRISHAQYTVPFPLSCQFCPTPFLMRGELPYFVVWTPRKIQGCWNPESGVVWQQEEGGPALVLEGVLKKKIDYCTNTEIYMKYYGAINLRNTCIWSVEGIV